MGNDGKVQQCLIAKDFFSKLGPGNFGKKKDGFVPIHTVGSNGTGSTLRSPDHLLMEVSLYNRLYHGNFHLEVAQFAEVYLFKKKILGRESWAITATPHGYVIPRQEHLGSLPELKIEKELPPKGSKQVICSVNGTAEKQYLFLHFLV